MNFSKMGHSHGLQFFMNCSSMGPFHDMQSFRSTLLQRGSPTGSQPPSGTHLLQRGVLHGLQVEICSPVDLHGLQGDSLPHHGLHHGLQGNLCSCAWSISSPPSSLTWVSAGLFLLNVLTPLSGCHFCLSQQLFFPS